MNRLRAEASSLLTLQTAGKFWLLLAAAWCSLLLVEALPAKQKSSGDSHPGSSAPDRIPNPGSPQSAAIPGTNIDRTYSLTAGELVDVVVANELQDREQLRKWIFVIEKRTANRSTTQVQVETKDGPLYRMLAVDGAVLTPSQRREDDVRIGRLVKDPRPLQKLKQAQMDDELKLQKLISLMPRAFVYNYDGIEGDFIRIKFGPNPNYNPPTYEARIVHSLAGTILLDPQQKRLAKVAGRLVNRVEFGYGLLGRIYSGTVELERVEVGPQLWKTAFINMHFAGRVALFKTINKDQYERRSNFQVVSSELSLLEAKDLLASGGALSPQILSTKK